MGKLKPVFSWFSGAFATYVGVQIFQACPDLLVQVPAIVGVGLTAAVAFWMRVPKTFKDAGLKVLVLGGISAGWVSMVAAFGEKCPAIGGNWSGFGMSLLLGALHLFAQGPREPVAKG